MAVVAMEKISVCALKTNRKAILETLQGLGVMQVVTDELDDPELLKMDTAEAKARFDKNADLADQAVAILDKYVPLKKGSRFWTSMYLLKKVCWTVLREKRLWSRLNLSGSSMSRQTS